MRAQAIADEDVAINAAIGRIGVELIEAAARRKNGARVNVLTHCNAGWLATVDIGTATAPIYTAHDKGIPVHVFVDETRPRNQGAALTAWELQQHGVPCTVIADNAGGHLMQRGQVDLVIVGADRATRQGDVCNKIGTYLTGSSSQSRREERCDRGLRGTPPPRHVLGHTRLPDSDAEFEQFATRDHTHGSHVPPQL